MGQPCLMPFVMENGADSVSFTRSLAVGVEYRASIHCNVWCKVSFRKAQSTQSKALYASRDRLRP